MSAHRTLNDLYRAFDSVGPGRIEDPGDAGTITISQWGQICGVTTATAETRILAAPVKPGIICSVVLDTYGGALTLTVNPTSGTCYGYNADNDTTITLGSAGDFVTFVSLKIGTEYVWRVLAQEGTTAATEDLTVDQLTATTANVTTASLTNATLGRFQITQTTVNAAGSAIGNATALSYGMNIVGAADNSKGVILPVAVANAVVDIISTVNAKSLLIYPQVNSTISGLSANGALTLGASNTAAAAGSQLNACRLVATNATQWYVVA